MPRLEDGTIGCDVGAFCGGALVGDEAEAQAQGWTIERSTSPGAPGEWLRCVCPTCLRMERMAPAPQVRD